MTETLSTIRQYLEAGQGDHCCRTLLKAAVAEIEALRRKQAYLTELWKKNSEHMRHQAKQLGLHGYIGDQIRLETRAMDYEQRAIELGSELDSFGGSL